VILAELVGPWTVALGVVVGVILLMLGRYARRGTRLKWRGAEVEFGAALDERLAPIANAVEQVSRQVNHVEDPHTEPTLRELTIDLVKRLTAVEIEVSATADHCAEARRLAGDAATSAATTEQLLGEHLREHRNDR
jgi:hypothetical protein